MHVHCKMNSFLTKVMIIATTIIGALSVQGLMPNSPIHLNRVPPCAKGQSSNCDSSRLKPCGTITSGFTREFKDVNTACASNGHIDPYVTETVLVQFTGSDGCKELLMQPGECWGMHPVNTQNSYDCQGRCGASCGTSVCSNWAADCLKHDVCSWYYGSSGGASDPNCGDEYNNAVDDTLQICAGIGVDACESKYDSIAASSKAYICPNRRRQLVTTLSSLI